MTELTFPRAHPDSHDQVKLDLFSGSRFTKHCKRRVAGFHFNDLGAAWGAGFAPETIAPKRRSPREASFKPTWLGP
jgi:hypothetical protein